MTKSGATKYLKLAVRYGLTAFSVYGGSSISPDPWFLAVFAVISCLIAEYVSQKIAGVATADDPIILARIGVVAGGIYASTFFSQVRWPAFSEVTTCFTMKSLSRLQPLSPRVWRILCLKN
jgi:hypothetical protein